MKAARCFWVDLDLPKGMPRAEAQAAIDTAIAVMPYGIPVPTWTLSSGNGCWLIWMLAEPVPLDGEFGDATATIEAIGIAIERAFASKYPKIKVDTCRNVDRICRLPGTVNQKGGALATVRAVDYGALYALADFPAPDADDLAEKRATNAESRRGEDAGAIEGPTADGGTGRRARGGRGRGASNAAILPTDDPQFVKVPKKFKDPDEKVYAGDYAGDRSRAGMAFLRACWEAAVPREAVERALWSWGIGQYLRDKGTQSAGG